jgi:diguanylate cyclase (GGDEF)-like protein
MRGHADPRVLAGLAALIRQSAWDLAVEVVEEGLRDDAVPSLGRLGRLGQLGDLPTFVAELARELEEPRSDRIRRGSPLNVVVRDHARSREGLGFAPREIVVELLLLRRVLWRFLAPRVGELETTDVLDMELRLNDAIDRLISECVAAYFDRATSELAHRARHDALTDLLDHAAFTRELEVELERARRYEHALELVFVDLDRFKQVNDTLGHLEGDRVLRRFAELLHEVARATDLVGRMGGDEFAVLLIETEAEAGGQFLSRLGDCVDELKQDGELPDGIGFSAGVAHFPADGSSVEALFRAADERLYDVKRSRPAES